MYKKTLFDKSVEVMILWKQDVKRVQSVQTTRLNKFIIKRKSQFKREEFFLDFCKEIKIPKINFNTKKIQWVKEFNLEKNREHTKSWRSNKKINFKLQWIVKGRKRIPGKKHKSCIISPKLDQKSFPMWFKNDQLILMIIRRNLDYNYLYIPNVT